MAIAVPSPLPAGTVLGVAIIGAGVSGIYTGPPQGDRRGQLRSVRRRRRRGRRS